MAQTILIVDDDPVQRRLLEAMTSRFGYEALTADGGDAALALLCGSQASRIHCVILDLVMPDLDGLGMLAKMRERGLRIPVIVQTAHGGIDNVVSVMRAGAADFVVKPVGPERLQVSLRNALATHALEGELQRMRHARAGTLTFRDLVSRSPQMQSVMRTAEKAAASSIPVLIEGESGVGKELIARAVHGSSERRAKPFVAVNCGAIPENLVESILFGHEKGAFTGATERHVGKFAEADGGVLFLDEIGELPPAAQVKLLRAIQENEIEPVGARTPMKIDVRLISATNRNLMADVQGGRFREDLFYRLHVFPITVPPLRDRTEDIPDLVRHFLARFGAEEGKRIQSVSAKALALLQSHSWPGNVRQLENTVFRAVVLAEGDSLGIEEFPQVAAQASGPADEGDAAAAPSPSITADMAVEPGVPAWAKAAAAPSQKYGTLPLFDNEGHIRSLDAIEAEVIRFAIQHYRGQMSEVARRLHIGRSTLYRKLENLGIESEKPASEAEAVSAG
jgi:DNA-binding NtrC family response regulator